MRALVLVVAMLLSAGSAKNAQQRHAVRSWACNSSTTMSAMQKQNCMSTANTQYAVESQRELVDEQNARADQQQAAWANQQNVARCDRVAGIFMRCQMVTPAQFNQARDYCVVTLSGGAPADYGKTICIEQSADCAGVDWCRTH